MILLTVLEGRRSNRGRKGLGPQIGPPHCTQTTHRLHTLCDQVSVATLSRTPGTVGEAPRVGSGRVDEALGEASPEPRVGSSQGLPEPPLAYSERPPDRVQGLVQIWHLRLDISMTLTRSRLCMWRQSLLRYLIITGIAVIGIHHNA